MKNMHKTHIFDQRNNAKKKFLPSYLPYFFSDRYRKQTIFFSWPDDDDDDDGGGDSGDDAYDGQGLTLRFQAGGPNRSFD